MEHIILMVVGYARKRQFKGGTRLFFDKMLERDMI